MLEIGQRVYIHGLATAFGNAAEFVVYGWIEKSGCATRAIVAPIVRGKVVDSDRIKSEIFRVENRGGEPCRSLFSVPIDRLVKL